MDLWLGGGQSVPALVAALRAGAPSGTPLPVIVCTADGSARARAIVARLDVQTVLPKPFDLLDVLTVVRTAVGAAASPPEPAATPGAL